MYMHIYMNMYRKSQIANSTCHSRRRPPTILRMGGHIPTGPTSDGVPAEQRGGNGPFGPFTTEMCPPRGGCGRRRTVADQQRRAPQPTESAPRLTGAVMDPEHALSESVEQRPRGVLELGEDVEQRPH